MRFLLLTATLAVASTVCGESFTTEFSGTASQVFHLVAGKSFNEVPCCGLDLESLPETIDVDLDVSTEPPAASVPTISYRLPSQSGSLGLSDEAILCRAQWALDAHDITLHSTEEVEVPPLTGSWDLECHSEGEVLREAGTIGIERRASSNIVSSIPRPAGFQVSVSVEAMAADALDEILYAGRMGGRLIVFRTGSTRIESTARYVAPCDVNEDSVCSVDDIDFLAKAIVDGDDAPIFDIDGDGSVDEGDHDAYLDMRGFVRGDANLNGRFDSRDLVNVFVRGQYEDGVPLNSTWRTGDWSGDLEFDTSDLVAAFQGGSYEVGPEAMIAVPEPGGIGKITVGLMIAGVSFTRRRSRSC